jgi:hypothetical protein
MRTSTAVVAPVTESETTCTVPGVKLDMVTKLSSLVAMAAVEGPVPLAFVSMETDVMSSAHEPDGVTVSV